MIALLVGGRLGLGKTVQVGRAVPREGTLAVELHLIRHGRTEWNASGRLQGQADIALDELGSRQATALAERARNMGLGALYTSDLQRCSAVADAITGTTGLEAVRDERLRERNVGEWSGLTRAQTAERFADDFAAWRAGSATVRPGGGETIGELEARIAAFFEVVRERHQGASVAAITHNGWIRVMLRWMLDEPRARDWFGNASQASVTTVHLGADRTHLVSFNDRGHLLAVEKVDVEAPTAENH